ncbi:riboflavin kinase, partial [Escherichia coli]|uniref:riboflavin kinase n=1 Tax=Escherichia coli TaxID=562 RepID=UPI0034D97DA5
MLSCGSVAYLGTCVLRGTVLALRYNLLPGVGNIEKRPTVSGSRQQLELHLLDVAMDLYGRHIQVVLRKKIRNEQRFASLDELKAQI